MKKMLTALPLIALSCLAAVPARADMPPDPGAMRAAAQQGDPDAEAALADFYADGQNMNRPDFAEAAKWYGKAAAQGDAESANALGGLYDSGQGVPQDYAKAAGFYRQGAQQGNPSAEYALGGYYEQGIGVPQDDVAAAQWYRQAADQGNTSAAGALSDFYVEGRGVPRDDMRADFWARVAARVSPTPPGAAPGAPDNGPNNEMAENAERLGKIEARLTPAQTAAVARSVAAWQPAETAPYAADAARDAVDVPSLHARAAQGDVQAEYTLGNIYDTGKSGVQRDYAQAFAMFRNAANSGFAPAQVSLGWYFEQGRGVPEDDTVAMRWYQTAAAHGYEPGRLAFARLNAPHVDAPSAPQGAGYIPSQGAGYNPSQGAGYTPPQGAGYNSSQGAGYPPPQGGGYNPGYNGPPVAGYNAPVNNTYQPQDNGDGDDNDYGAPQNNNGYQSRPQATSPDHAYPQNTGPITWGNAPNGPGQ